MKSDITYQKKLSCLSGYLHKKSLILDIGCGNGVFVKLAKKAGFRAFGFDIDKSVSADYHSLAKIPAHYFDALTSFDVIEHTSNPKKFLLAIKPKLKPKGLLLLTTPNRDGIAGRIIKNKFWGLNPAGHQTIFTLASLKNLLEKAGFEILEFKTDTLGWWYLTNIYWLNRIINKIVYSILFPFKNLLFSRNLGDNLQIIARKNNV